jgi:hypothetical protein
MTFVINLYFYGEGLLTPRPSPKLEDHPLSAVCSCLFNVFKANFRWKPSLYLRPKDVPCCGDWDPDQDVGGWIILEWILLRWDGVMQTRLVWLRIGTGEELL